MSTAIGQASAPATGPVPIVALDFPTAVAAMRMVDRLPESTFWKVGLQLFTAEGPAVVRALKRRRARVFLDLKLHDIPNTVAGAVRAAAALEADLLTIHASGGSAMLAAAAEAARSAGYPIRLLAVSVLTSLDAGGLARAWGRHALDVADEVSRLAALSAEAGIDGMVASVHEVVAVRRAAPGLLTLAPGIRLAGTDAGDQARVATPADAARAGADYVVLGRTVTAAEDPPAAFARAAAELAAPGNRA